MSEIKALEELRKYVDKQREEYNNHNVSFVWQLGTIADEIEVEIAERYMLKDDAKLDKTAVQEYNLTVHVADGQTIEYNTELRHRCGAATSMSVAFRLE